MAAHHTVPDSDKHTSSGSDAEHGGGRAPVITSITTVMKFYALIVLVSETIVLTAAHFSDGFIKVFLTISMVVILVIIIIIVGVFAYKKPWVLTGAAAPGRGAVAPPPDFSSQVTLQYFLRGIRTDYLACLNDIDPTLPIPTHVRINVMLVGPTGANSDEKVLMIKYTDYPHNFTYDELVQPYMSGKACCGEAWQLGTQRFWAEDLDDAARVVMDTVKSQTALARKSVISSPLFWGSECIGVLNLDSNHDSKSTFVDRSTVLDVINDGARAVVPLLLYQAKV